MKRIHVAIIGAIAAVAIVATGFWAWHHRSSQTQAPPSGPVYAYVDMDHIMMSHPSYSQYHRTELEYNAMIARYQFEQWDFSRKAAARDKITAAGNGMDSHDFVMTAALDQEMKARIALKENELNSSLKQRAESLLQEKSKVPPETLDGDSLKIVNLQLQLNTLSMTAEERKSTQEKLYALMRSSGKPAKSVPDKAMQEVTAEMAPYKEKAQQELAAYAAQVKKESEARQQDSHALFQPPPTAIAAFDTPEPAVWNQEWKDKLNGKEKELKDQKEAILADIRDKAAIVAQEQGIDMIFSDYMGYGTALDVTDDIIAKLA